MVPAPPLSFGDFVLTTVVTGSPWYENCYVVRHAPSGELVVVDPGGDAERIAAAVAADGGTPTAIWLTHGHPDHLGAAAALQALNPVPCHAHRDEEAVIARAPQWGEALMGAALDPPADCRYFEDGDSMVLGGVRVRVHHTPGHTPGGVCYDFGAFVLTGDTLFDHGIGRTDLPGGRPAALVASITRLLETVAADAVLFSGHGAAWSATEARHWWARMS